GIADQPLDLPLVIALARTAIAIPDQVVRQEPAEQFRPFAGAVRQDLCHQASVIIIDDRLRNRAEEGKGMDMAVDPGFGHRRGIGPDIAGIAMRQVQNEEMSFLLNTTTPDLRLAKIGLRMTRRMRQRHKYFLPTLLPLPNVILDDRVTAGEPAFLAEPVEYPLCRVPLFARHMAIRLK